MATWKSRGSRGSLLEESINRTNEKYREHGLALVQKIPTPITPMEMNGRMITKAFFAQKSTVDYMGIVQGIPVCFEAKESKKKRFPFDSIHEHQVKFMEEYEKQDGCAFLIIDFTVEDKCFYVPFRIFKEFWDKGKNGGKKSFKFDELDEKWLIKKGNNVIIPYLEKIKLDMEERDSC